MDKRLSLTQLDLLNEMSTIGAGWAATALADLIGAKVEISVPQTSLVPLENTSCLLGASDQTFFVLDTEITGDITARIFLLFPPDDARSLSGILLSKTPEEIDFNDDLFRSSLTELANILSGSFVSALAKLTNMKMIGSVPSLAMDMVGAILDFIFIQIAQRSEEALYIKTDLEVSSMKLNGFFLFFPETESLTNIFNSLGLKNKTLPK